MLPTRSGDIITLSIGLVGRVMILATMILLQTTAPTDDAALMNEYRLRTSARIPCQRTADSDEIVVCARRNADQYRVPIVDDAQLDYNTPARRVVALKEPTQCDKRSPFLVGCGAAGISVTTSLGKNGKTHVRPLAP